MKYLVLTLGLVFSTSALAEGHRHGHRHHQRQHQPNHNGLAIGLGILGLGLGGMYMFQQNNNIRECWNEVARDAYGRTMYDYRGNPILDQVCR